MGEPDMDGGPARSAYQNWRAKWRWPVRSVFLGGMVALFAFTAGFFVFAEHVSGMRTPAEAVHADGIIVLTGGEARLEAAIGLLKAHKARRLLISGVNPRAAEGNLPRALGVEKALFDCCVDIDHSVDTISNASESAKWIAARGYRDIILVTNNYHMPRSLMEMKRFTDGVSLLPYPVVNTDLADGSWLRRPQAFRVLFTEYTKFLLATARLAIPGEGRIHAASAAASWH
jgi:uncharacterized SAM-binding protein YcdF (DUF218 family)